LAEVPGRPLCGVEGSISFGKAPPTGGLAEGC
jgi:hypothetical protein